MLTRAALWGLLGFAASLSLAAAQQQAPLVLGGSGATTPGTTTYVEPNSAVGYAGRGELLYPLDTVQGQRLAVVMEYLRQDGVRDTLGSITAYEDGEGTSFKLVVTRFTPGFKGFHLLSHGDCDPVVRGGRLELGGGAAGLYDPGNTDRHEGPFGNGYLGALPKAEANAQGWIFMTLVAPRVRLADLRGRALVLREFDDSYKPAPPLGGSGGIASCGLVR